MTNEATRIIEVGALTRVEGEGALRVFMEGNSVVDVQLAIYEPPRFFEALLRGRPLEETPDITARICGICPIAYQMTSVHALEQALGIQISPEIRQLRRLLYCGEWIESHGVHMHLLHIPDFFGCQSSIELARKFPAEVNRGLRLKKIGNELLAVLGGRAVHPVNVTVGGFYRSPRKSEVRKLVDEFKWGLEAAIDTARWVASFEYPDFERECEMIALQHDQEYPMNEGLIASTASEQTRISPQEFERTFEEVHVSHSTALQSKRIASGRSYYVGPLARINLNRSRLAPMAYELSQQLPIRWPCFNPYQALVARGIEVVHAFEEALGILERYEECQPARVNYEPVAGEGCWATEAPRGLIYQRYRTTEDGKVAFAKIVPPTSQNQRQIELDLLHLLPRQMGQDDTETALACERLIRSYDPCISCSTHFLRLEIVRK